jgi:8-oxo-dGTP diphosphatase
VNISSTENIHLGLLICKYYQFLNAPYALASTILLETEFHILLVEPAVFCKAAIIAITINETISPYSTAVAPCSHRVMRRISTNISGPTSFPWLRAVGKSHTSVNKTLQGDEKLEKNPTALFVVAAALTNQDGEILLQKRPAGRQMAGLWEFPGGKIEEGESPESALIRELEEELGVIVEGANLVPLTFASEPLGDRHLLLLLYRCIRWEGIPDALDGQKLQWVKPAAMRDLPMPPADKPLVTALENIG